MNEYYNMCQKTTGIHEQQFFAEQSKPIRPGAIGRAIQERSNT